MGLGLGLISCQRSVGDPRSWTEVYADALELTEYAETLGFTSVWTTEHHFVDDGYMPSLLPTMAAMAARTERIEIGSGVVLAPLYHPLRLAEDAATVQLISKGRLALGLGLGWSEIEFETFGADIRRRGRAMDEILQILPQAWSGDPVSHHGDVYDFPEVIVRPIPEAKIPVLIGGNVDAAVRRAARYADGFFSNSSPGRLVEQVHVALDELEAVGRDPSDFRLVYYVVAYPGDTAEQAWDEVADYAWAIRWKYSDMDAAARRSGGIADVPPLDAAMAERVRRATYLGPNIADQLNEIQQSLDVPIELVVRSYFPGMPQSQQREVMARLAEEVAPHV